MSKTIGIAFMAAPVVLVILFALIWFVFGRIRRSIATVPPGWLTTQALVVDEGTRYDPGPGYDNRGMTFVRTPIVRFTDAAGGTTTARSQVEGTFMPRPGTVVTIHFDPADPRRVRVSAQSLPRANRTLPVVVAVVGLVIFVPLAVLLELIGYVTLNA